MFKAENRHLLANLPTSWNQKFLKFCYFTLALLILGCGEDKKDKTAPDSSEIEVAEQTETAKTSSKTILCFGDSITAGYGLEDTEDAFPGLLQDKIDALDLDYTVINSGLSGETSAGGKGRIDWILNQNIDIFLLELGANDGLRGVALSETRANLQAIINTVKEKSPATKIILAGMQLPPNMGQDYTTEFKQLFIDLAEENNLAFIPFILENVGGIAELNQSDGIHPTEEGHEIVANTVWEVLKPML
ncbi:MAG: arylesterase [Cellulophaga sp.]|nr:arylesterase [Cellulophaga sp.]